jgi:hypothetical protein
MKEDTVLIPDCDGSNRLLKLFRSPADGDIYVSIVTPDKIITRESIRICTNQGSPSHGDICNGLREAFLAALSQGWGRIDKTRDPFYEGFKMKIFKLEEEIRELKDKLLEKKKSDS